MYTALIIDDEKSGTESLSLLLEMYCPKIKVISTAHQVEDAITLITNQNPDILFLDIEMPSGSGFEVVERTKGFKRKVIFTTAYENHAIKAIKANAVDYLLKPIAIEDLILAVNKVIFSLENDSFQKIEISKKLVNPGQKIAIPSNDGLLFFETCQIVRVEADSNYAHIVLQGGKKITACKTLKEIEALLPSQFFRIHNTHLINLDYVKKYIKGDGGCVLLEDGEMIPVSRSQKNAFLSIFQTN